MSCSIVRCYGSSMDYLFASGDRLTIDPEARKAPEKIKAGDIVAYLDWAGNPSVSVHRVIFRFRTNAGGWKFLTKGDGNLWFDPLADSSRLTGKVTGLLRGAGEPVRMDSGPCYWAGLVIAVYSLFAAAASRCCGAAARAAVYAASCAQAAAMVSCRRFPPAAALVPFLLKFGLWADPDRYEHFYPAFSWLPVRLMDLAAAFSRGRGALVRGAAAPAEADGDTILAGKIKGRLTLGGRVTICGDVAIMPGAALVLLPGASVSFSSVKSTDGYALRAAGGGLREFRNDKLCRIAVYGEFTCAGSAAAPVTLGGERDAWESVVFFGRSRGVLENVMVSGAVSPFWAMDLSRVSLSAVSAPGAGAVCVAAGCSIVEVKGTLTDGIPRPVSALDLARLTIRDCGFSGSDTAVHASGAARCRVADTRITGGRLGLYAAGARVLGVNVSIRGCLGQGVLLEDGAVFHGRGGEITGSGSQAACSRKGAEIFLSGMEITGGPEGIASEGLGTRLRGVRLRGNREFSVRLNGGKHKLTSCLIEGGKTGIGVYKNARCVINGLWVSGLEGAGLEAASARVVLAGAKFRACGTGLKINGGGDVRLNAGTITGCGTGMAAVGGARVSLSGSSFGACAKGVWLQDGAEAEIAGCVFENNSFAGVYADKSGCSARETSFKSNNIGVFSDRGAVVRLSGTEFSGGRTGVKADRLSRLELRRCAVRGCGWDGIWCAGNSELKLELNEFVSNGCAIKEDGPCAVSAAGNSFASNKTDRLSWPRS